MHVYVYVYVCMCVCVCVCVYVCVRVEQMKGDNKGNCVVTFSLCSVFPSSSAIAFCLNLPTKDLFACLTNVRLFAVKRD